MAKRPRRQKFWRYIAHGLFWMALANVINLGFAHTSLGRRMVNANLDALFASRNIAVSPDIIVVWITDEDYNNPALFAGVSPLKPEVLIRVIKAIVQCDPRAVGIDFDTSAWTPGQFDARAISPNDVPIVWARAAVEAGAPGGEAHASQDLPHLQLNNALGGAEDICYGAPAYLPDEDDVVRQYRQYIPGGSGEFFPSLALNLAEVYRHGAGACRKTTRQLPSSDAAESKLINYRGAASAFSHLSVGALLKLVESEDWRANNPLKQKLVLLGGDYRAARDFYMTPVGNLPGVDILANTAQAQLPGNALTLGPGWLDTVGYLESLVLLVAFYYLPHRWGLLVTLLTGPLYALALNWLAFQWGGAFLTFVPSFVGLVVHRIVEEGKQHHKLLQENEKLEQEVKKLRAGQHSFSQMNAGERE